jgi:hypothetical protein
MSEYNKHMQGLLAGGYCIDDPVNRVNDVASEAIGLALILILALLATPTLAETSIHAGGLSSIRSGRGNGLPRRTEARKAVPNHGV